MVVSRNQGSLFGGPSREDYIFMGRFLGLSSFRFMQPKTRFCNSPANEILSVKFSVLGCMRDGPQP